MAVYSKSGTALTQIYGKSGNSLDIAYDKSKNVVFTSEPVEPVVNYDDYTAESLYKLSWLGNHTQGMATYNGYIVAFREADLMYTYRLATGAGIANAIPAKSDHGGSASFSGEFYNQSDAFPLLYVSSDNTNIYVNRITTTSSELVRTLYFPNDPYGYYIKGAVDTENNLLYTLSYKENDYKVTSATNNVIIAKWDLSDLTDNGDDTYTPKLISSFERAFIYVLQFATFHDGMLWVGSGYGSPTPSRVYALDINTGNILHTILLSDVVEIEGASFVLDEETGDYYLIVLQWGGQCTKYTFGKK